MRKKMPFSFFRMKNGPKYFSNVFYSSVKSSLKLSECLFNLGFLQREAYRGGRANEGAWVGASGQNLDPEAFKLKSIALNTTHLYT